MLILRDLNAAKVRLPLYRSIFKFLLR